MAYLLNLFDLCCTLYALPRGAVELNPLMRCVPVMIVYKVAVVGELLWWLSRRPERLARAGMWLCTAVYAALCARHLCGLARIA